MYLFCIGKDRDNFVIWKKYNEIFTKNLKMLSVTCSFIGLLIMPIIPIMPIMPIIQRDFESLGREGERVENLRRNESFWKDFRKV